MSTPSAPSENPCSNCYLTSQGLTFSRRQESNPPYFSFNVSIMQGSMKFIAEVIGTALLMFGGCMGCLSWDEKQPSFLGAMSFGLVVMIVIQCYGHVSGAHLNPAVTIAAVVYRTISIPMAVIYFFAQLIGAVLGYGLLKLLTPADIMLANYGDNGFCATALHKQVSVAQAFGIEFFATMILVTLCCGVWDPRNSKNQDSVPLKFGFSIFVLSLIFGPYTGCSMNPVRTFAPAFWNGEYDNQWIYWIAPLLSAVVTSVAYRILFFEKAETDEEVIKPLRHSELPKV